MQSFHGIQYLDGRLDRIMENDERFVTVTFCSRSAVSGLRLQCRNDHEGGEAMSEADIEGAVKVISRDKAICRLWPHNVKSDLIVCDNSRVLLSSIGKTCLGHKWTTKRTVESTVPRNLDNYLDRQQFQKLKRTHHIRLPCPIVAGLALYIKIHWTFWECEI